MASNPETALLAPECEAKGHNTHLRKPLPPTNCRKKRWCEESAAYFDLCGRMRPLLLLCFSQNLVLLPYSFLEMDGICTLVARLTCHSLP
jgi:hypothetical protein